MTLKGLDRASSSHEADAMERAATKLQAVQRGQSTRRRLQQKRQERRDSLMAADDFSDRHGTKDAPQSHMRHDGAANSLVHELEHGITKNAHHKLDGLATKPAGSGMHRYASRKFLTKLKEQSFNKRGVTERV